MKHPKVEHEIFSAPIYRVFLFTNFAFQPSSKALIFILFYVCNWYFCVFTES